MNKYPHPDQLYLPRFFHGITNMESGVISLKEAGCSIERIARGFGTSTQKIQAILLKYGYDTKENPNG